MSQVWLITGSSRGLGRALAEGVLAAGHKLIATARKSAQLNDLAEKYGDQARLADLDVTDAASALNAVEVAVDAFGRLDVLANNAGYGKVGSIEDTPMDEFREIIETNLFGVINVTESSAPGHAGTRGRPHSPILVCRRTDRGNWPRPVFCREMGRGGFFGSACQRGRASWHQGDSHRVGRISHRLCRGFHSDPWRGVLSMMPPSVQRPGFSATSTANNRAIPPKRRQSSFIWRPLKNHRCGCCLATMPLIEWSRMNLARIEEDRKWRPLSVSTDFE